MAYADSLRVRYLAHFRAGGERLPPRDANAALNLDHDIARYLARRPPREELAVEGPDGDLTEAEVDIFEFDPEP